MREKGTTHVIRRFRKRHTVGYLVGTQEEKGRRGTHPADYVRGMHYLRSKGTSGKHIILCQR